jgi:hypothetical protein
MPLEGGFGSLHVFTIGRMPGDRNLLSLDASLAIPTRVLRFEASRVGGQGGQTAPPGWLDQPGRSDRPQVV